MHVLATSLAVRDPCVQLLRRSSRRDQDERPSFGNIFAGDVQLVELVEEVVGGDAVFREAEIGETLEGLWRE